MTDTKTQELEGLTLNVYLYVAKKGKPVGPRDVTKGVNLSSPSVAYRHLQKLEDSGFLQRDTYGEYTLKRKAHINGFFWVGKRLVPKLWSYALLFLFILLAELYVLILHFAVENYEFKVFFLLLTLVTSLAFAVFAVEGFLQSKRRRISATEYAV